MRIVPIASSSKGNAYIVEHSGEALLIDCGVSFKTVRQAFDSIGIGLGELPERLKGVLVTHNHTDHVNGLAAFLGKVNVPVFANVMTAETVGVQLKIDDSAFCCFENGQPFDLGPFTVSPFSIPHDATDPVGFLVKSDLTYFHGTDIGSPLDSIGLKLAEADIATLEANHDPMMLRASSRPVSLKQRISGPRGHLSNDDAADLVRRFASPRLKCLFLAHLSHECNQPHLAERALREALAEMGRTDVRLSVLK